MESSLTLPVAEKFFDGLQSAEVTIEDWDYPSATIKAVIQTYRGDFFEDFTKNDVFKVKCMQNIWDYDANTWELEIKFTQKFEDEIIPLMKENQL